MSHLGVQLSPRVIRSLRSAGSCLQMRHCVPQFSVLLDTPEVRQLLDDTRTSFQSCDEGLLVVGTWSDVWTAYATSPHRSMLPAGRVPMGDPVARQLLALVMDAVVPITAVPGSLCCLSLPAALSREAAEDQSSLDYFARLATLQGWEPRFVNAGLALVLAELGAHRLTGMGVVIDDVATQASLVVYGREIAAASVRHDFQSDAADGRGVPTDQLRDQLIVSFETIRRRMTSALARAVPGPVAVDCVPFTTDADVDRTIREAWKAAGWSRDWQQILRPAHSVRAIARGCLIHAELETLDRRKAA